MIFRQLFEPGTSTYTYVIGSQKTGQAVLIDPVVETFQRDLDVLAELNLQLAYTLETHIHADHLTAALKLRALMGSRIAVPALAGVECADVQIEEDQPFKVGSILINPIYTPGHTDHHFCYGFDMGGVGAVLTGDCLLIEGCGRTDFQGGNSEQLYQSVTQKLFTLPGETLVYPAHDYNGRRVSSIAQEISRNSRLGEGNDLKSFEKIMSSLDLPYPKQIDLAVPANMLCGQCPDDVPEGMQRLCDMAIQG